MNDEFYKRIILLDPAVLRTPGARNIHSSVLAIHQRLVDRVMEFTLSPQSSTIPYIRNVLLKPVSDNCNLRCSYCYEKSLGYETSTKKMSLEVLENTIRLLLLQGVKSIRFNWHGGEPLLLGTEFFQTVIKLQKKWNLNECKIENVVQTNGTLLNPRWYDFLEKHRFRIGISFDGIKRVHDQFRFDRAGKGTFETVASKLKELNDRNISYHIISVISEHHRGYADLYYENILGLDVRSFDIHPSFTDLSRYVSPIVFSEFAVELFENWLRDNRHRNFSLVTDYLTGRLQGQSESCYFSGRCTQIVAVDGDGDMIPCTRPFDRAQYTFGNISQGSIESVTRNSNFTRFYEEDKEAISNRRDCKWWTICKNGCPQYRMKDGKPSISGNSVYCSCNNPDGGGYFHIWDHFDRTMRELFASD